MNFDTLDPYQKYLLAWFVKPLQAGEGFVRDWPLHLTLVPWFWIRDLEKTIAAIEAVIQRQAALKITCTDESYLAGGRTRVRLVQKTDELEKFHQSLIDLINGLALPMMDKFTGKQYLPHITVRGADYPAKGDRFSLDHLALVRALPERTRLVQGVLVLPKK